MIILALYVCRLQLFRNAQESAVGKLFPVYIIPWGRIRERTEIGTTWLRSDKLEFQPFHILQPTDGLYTTLRVSTFAWGRREGDNI